MTVSNGQIANETTFNNAFLSRLEDTDTVGTLDLLNAEAESGDSLFNLQRIIRSLLGFTGQADDADFDDTPTWVNNDVGTSGDDLFERADALTERFDPTTGHTHDGSAGDGGPIDATDLTNVRLKGVFVQGGTITATGGTHDVTSGLSGKSVSSGETVKGLPTSSPYNKVMLRDGTAATEGDLLKSAAGDIVYARVTESSGTWTLTFYTNVAGVETAYTLFSSQSLFWYYQELFSPLSDIPIYSELASIPSDNATQDVIDATSTARGLISAGTQSIGGAKTLVDSTQSTTKDTGALILEGGLGVEKNINAGGAIAATGAVTGSNLSGTNTGDKTFDQLSPMTTLGDVIYGGASGTGTRLAGNITTTRKFLRQTGDGANSAAPAWDTLQVGDIPAGAQGSGGGSFVWVVPDSNGAVESFYGGGVSLLDFGPLDTAEVWAFVRVPDTYSAGVQIFLKGLSFVIEGTSGNVLFRATTYLLRTGAGNMSATTPSGDSYASTNAQVAVSGTAFRSKAVGDVDLTNASGQINSVAVAAGDWLAIKLVRDTASETSGTAFDARLVRFSGSPKFTA